MVKWQAAATAPKTMIGNPGLERELWLAELHRQGDDRAFDEVYRQYLPQVYNLCLRLCHSAEDAEDLAQETFIRIYRHLGGFDGRASLKTWVYRVTVNLCSSRLSRRKLLTLPVRTSEDPEEEGVLLVDPERTPESLALARDAAERVEAALRLLQPNFRAAVILRDLEGLAYEEIAEVLEIHIGTVRSRIARGREGLRLLLEKAEGQKRVQS
jgi:RNA polymerase sigma-70 factor (ECF subfamily)